jgi:hypothetical protein
MSSQWPKAGPNHVPSYLTSGIPYVTSSSATDVPEDASGVSPYQVDFPYVTKFVTVNNIGTNDLRVAFTALGCYAPSETYTDGQTLDSDHPRNYFVIREQEAGSMQTVTFDVRCKSVFFLSDNTGTTGVSVLAGLTTIPAESFPVITGSVDSDGITAFNGVG